MPSAQLETVGAEPGSNVGKLAFESIFGIVDGVPDGKESGIVRVEVGFAKRVGDGVGQFVDENCE